MRSRSYVFRRVAVLIVLAASILPPLALAEDGPSRPTAPVGLLALSDLEGSALLTWQPPLDDGGAPITEYRVYRTEDGRNYSLLAAPTSTTYTDPLVGPDAPLYLYRVTAVNEVGEGTAATTPFIGTACIGTIPEPPFVIIDPGCIGKWKVLAAWP